MEIIEDEEEAMVRSIQFADHAFRVHLDDIRSLGFAEQECVEELEEDEDEEDSAHELQKFEVDSRQQPVSELELVESLLASTYERSAENSAVKRDNQFRRYSALHAR